MYSKKGYGIYEEAAHEKTYGNEKKRRNNYSENGKVTEGYANSQEAAMEKNGNNENQPAAVYEGSTYIPKTVTYTLPKRSDIDNNRKIKKISEQILEQYEQISIDSFKGQLEAYRRNNAASVWKLLSSGDLAMGTESKTRARHDVSEDGYWGVKCTSERLFDFAKTMSGGNSEAMKKMRNKMEEAAIIVTKEWGSELPGLCQETIQLSRKHFANFLASEGEIVN